LDRSASMIWRKGLWLLVLCWSLFACGGEDSAVLTPDASTYAWLDGDTLAAQHLNFTTGEKSKFRQISNLLELRPVSLPREEWLYQSSRGEFLDHFGWPVGSRVDDSIFVLYVRIAAHGKFDDFYKATVGVRRTVVRRFSSCPGLRRARLTCSIPRISSPS